MPSYSSLHTSRTAVLAITGFLLMCARSQAGYIFQNIVDNADPTFNQALSINSAGTIAGYFGSGADAAHPNKGWVVTPPYTQANFVNENFPGSVQTQVTGINTTGETVGFYVDVAGANHGFTDLTGTFSTVDNPATTAVPPFNQLLGVNGSGLAAGFYNDAAGNSHAYVYNPVGSLFTAVLPSGATSAAATGINNTNVISGFAVIGGMTEGFIDTAGSFKFFEVGTDVTQFLGINNAGKAVGFYTDAAGTNHGILYDIATGTYQTIDDPSAGTGDGNGTVINGLNDNGQLVGFYTFTNVNGAPITVGLLATAVPEPGSLALAALGLIATVGWRKRRTS